MSAKPGLMPAAEDRHAALLARGDEPVAAVAEGVAGDERGGADHVDAGLEDPHHLVDVRPLRVVDDAVGPQREQRVDVVGGGRRPTGSMPQSSPTSRPDLVGAPGEAPDQLEAGVGGDGDHRPATDVAGRPLHDPERDGGMGGAHGPERR